MEQSPEDQALNEFDGFQKRTNEIYPADRALEYLTLRLTSEVGQMAKEVAQIARGDYESKGAYVYEEAISNIMKECNDILHCVALVATVLEKRLSDIIAHGREMRKQHTL